MKGLILMVLLCAGLCSFGQLYNDDSRIQNEFIVQVKQGQSVKDAIANYTGVTVQKNISQRMNIWLLERNTTTGSEEFLSALRTNEYIKVAQFNHRIQQRSIVPNDTFFNIQWNMLNTGQNGGTSGADISAPEAWEINHNNLTVNGDTIVVAVIDVSYDTNHDDLNFFRNYHEVPKNAIDDDGNGYIDDYEGWNPVQLNGNVTAFVDPHSMHISGIIGAKGDNRIGVAGTCWGVQVMRLCGSGSDEDDVVGAYDYVIAMRSLYNNTAGQKGAFIVSTNTSFGVDRSRPADFPIWCAMYDSLGAYGILSAGATNNSKINVDTQFDIPTTCPSKWLIAVTNTNNKDALNAAYGAENIDMGAPGTGIYSTFSNNGYGYRSGTSMATPHVAGAIAAMYAAACPQLIDDYYAYPDSIALILRQMILDGTDHISSLHNLTVTGGRLNLYHALKNLENYNCDNCAFSLSTVVEQPLCSNSCDGSIEVTAVGNTMLSYTNSNLCPGYYPIIVTDTAGCSQTKNIWLYKPDSIVISSINITQPSVSSPGNIIIGAEAGNYQLEYSLDGGNYQVTSTFSIDTPGHYTAYIRSETGCVVQQNLIVYPLGIEENIALNDWNMYPNPSTDALNITLELAANTMVQFSITNTLGEIVWQQAKQIAPGIHTATIPVATLQSGIYFVSINTGTASSKKLVIAR